MNDIIEFIMNSENERISSVELCEVLKKSGIEKRHDHVMRDVDNMSTPDGGVSVGTYVHPQNRQNYRCHMLSKPVAIAVVCSYSFSFSLKISNLLLGIDADISFEKKGHRQQTYFIFNPMTSMIKIGKSVDVARRMNTLSTQSGCELELLHVIDADVESELHSKFKHIRHHGEWFYDEGQIREFICAEYQ